MKKAKTKTLTVYVLVCRNGELHKPGDEEEGMFYAWLNYKDGMEAINDYYIMGEELKDLGCGPHRLVKLTNKGAKK